METSALTLLVSATSRHACDAGSMETYAVLPFSNDFHLIGSVTIISHNTYVWRGDVSPTLQISR